MEVDGKVPAVPTALAAGATVPLDDSGGASGAHTSPLVFATQTATETLAGFVWKQDILHFFDKDEQNAACKCVNPASCAPA